MTICRRDAGDLLDGRASARVLGGRQTSAGGVELGADRRPLVVVVGGGGGGSSGGGDGRVGGVDVVRADAPDLHLTSHLVDDVGHGLLELTKRRPQLGARKPARQHHAVSVAQIYTTITSHSRVNRSMTPSTEE